MCYAEIYADENTSNRNQLKQPDMVSVFKILMVNLAEI